MFDAIRLSDKTTYGGIILEGSSGVIFMELLISCMLDKVFCPIHGETIITEEDFGSRVNGKPITLRSHRYGYGCILISSLLIARRLQHIPIDLKKIPERTELPVPPDKFRQLTTIPLCIVFGAVSVFSFWRGSGSTHTIWFWFCSLLVPFSISFMGYVSQLRRYENEHDRIVWQNHLHQRQYDRQVAIGKLAMEVLATACITPVARNKLAVALLQGGGKLQPFFHSQYQRMLSTTLISPQLTNVSENGCLLHMEQLLTDIIRQLQPELEEFSESLHIRIQHGGTLKNKTTNTVWRRVRLLSFDDQNLTICAESDGVMWINKYLDCQESTLIPSIKINLLLEPRDRQVESVSAILLASAD